MYKLCKMPDQSSFLEKQLLFFSRVFPLCVWLLTAWTLAYSPVSLDKMNVSDELWVSVRQ